MTDGSSHAHCASALVAVDSERAFEYLGDGIRQGEWTLGSRDRREVGPGIFVGTSMFDGIERHIRVDPDPARLLIVCSIGNGPDDLRPVVWLRVLPGPELGHPADVSVVSLMVWRSAGDDGDKWAATTLAFDLEALIVRARLEHPQWI